MKKFSFHMLALLIGLFLLPTTSSAQLEDGTYSLNYQVNSPSSASASIANDYFVKPAKLIVGNGTLKIQLTIKNSAWITEFSSPHGGNKMLGEDKTADTRLVEFNITGINSPTVMKMKVDIEDLNYHHVYSTDFAWNASSVKLIEAAKKAEPVKQDEKVETKLEAKVEPKAEPKTTTKQETVATTAKTTEKVTAATKETMKSDEKSEPNTKTEEKQPEEIAVTTEAESTDKEQPEVKTEEVAEEVEETPAEATEEGNSTEVAEQSEQALLASVTPTTDVEKSNTLLYTLIVIVLVAIAAITMFVRKKKAA